MKESDYEKRLNIKTAGVQKWGVRSADDHPYETTPYEALEQLFNHYELRQSDRVVDFGCGKGRLPFLSIIILKLRRLASKRTNRCIGKRRII